MTHRFALLVLPFLLLGAAGAFAEEADPLPSWREGEAKARIRAFVAAVTKEGGPRYVPPAERIAVFDNDGTLWCEQPVVQIAFLLDEVTRLAPEHPEWTTTQPYKAALERDVAWLEHDYHTGKKGLMQLLAATHMGMTQAAFQASVKTFFEEAKHPKLGRSYASLAYQPMLELLAYLRANGFETWICSGGGIHFMRVMTEEIYGIPPQQVIGSHAGLTFKMVDGKAVFDRTKDGLFVNDKEGKPVGIELHIGRQPIFAAGNVRSGGDIAMLTYAQASPRETLQLMVNHDDAEREYAYAEEDDASLNAAKAKGWQVVSMKKDWALIFP